MTAERWQRVQELFAAAVALPPAGREAYLERAAGADAALLAEVRALLATDARADTTLEGIVGAAAAGLLAERAGMRDAWIGRRLGPWQIEAHLADGGMGAVYRAQRADGVYEQTVAVKLLGPVRMSPAAAARLARERQILARLAHRNIARLLDGGTTDDGVPYLVMEYIDGVPIDEYCNTQGLGTAERLRLFLQLCEAVDFAHRNLVVHRDLKPNNVLVDAQGVPKLLDFGISKLLEEDGATLTGAHERVLTPAHASPEQIRGETVTTATDVYALGVLLYDVLAGRLPFIAAGRTAANVARDILDTDPARPSSVVSTGSNARLESARRRGETLTADRLRRELEGDLDNVVLTALRKEPERRYASVRALADDVENVLAHRPVAAHAPTLAYRAGKFVRRNRVGVLASLAVVFGAAAMLGYYTWRVADERDRALAAERRARETADFLAELLRGTAADAGAPRQTSVQQLLDGAAKRVREELADNPALGTPLRAALGHAYHSWGAYDAADAILKEALQKERERAGAPTRDLAEVIALLGIVAHDRGDLPGSLEWAQQEAVLWRALGDDAELGNALNGIGISLHALGRTGEAEKVYAEALQVLHRAHGDEHDGIAWALNNLGWLLHSGGRYGEALQTYQRALAMQRKVKAPVVAMAQTLKNLGGLHYHLGDYARAESLWAESLKINVDTYGADGHVAVANVHALMSLVALDRGQFDEAERQVRQAMQINLKVLGAEHRRTASDWSSLARVLLAADRLDEAEQAIGASLRIREALLPPQHVETGSSHELMGTLLVRRGEFARAQAELERARGIFEQAGAADAPRMDSLLLQLGLCAAGRQRIAEGAGHIRRALDAMRGRLPADHWRIRMGEGLLLTPPFVAADDAAAAASVQAILADLRQRLGPQAPGVRAIERRLAAARQRAG